MTASVASVETVIAVPSAIASTDRMPPTQRPFRKAKVSTISAPEQGRRPTAATADQAVFQLKRSPASMAGSGAWLWPQVVADLPVGMGVGMIMAVRVAVGMMPVVIV